MQKTLALVLKKQNLGETDRIITVLSPTLGKKRIVAKAVRRPLSKLAGHLDTLMLTQIILTDQDVLPRVTSAVLAEGFETIRGSLKLATKAFAITKLVERLVLEDVPNRQIFAVSVEALSRLNGEEKWSAIWLKYLSQLTDNLGVGLSNWRCLRCNEPVVDDAFFIVSERRLVCGKCNEEFAGPTIPMATNSIKLLSIVRTKPFDTLRRVNLPSLNALQVEEILLREITDWMNRPWSEYGAIVR